MVEWKKGKELIEKQDSARDEFEDSWFYLKRIRLSEIKEVQEGIATLDWWMTKSGDNEDGYHTKIVEGMMETLREGGTLPEVILMNDKRLYDGHHRCTAYVEMGVEWIEVYIEMEEEL